MIWQDLVLAAANVAFFVTLLPPLLRFKPRPPASLAFPTGIILGVSAFTQATLGLYSAAATVGALGAVWLIISRP